MAKGWVEGRIQEWPMAVTAFISWNKPGHRHECKFKTRRDRRFVSFPREGEGKWKSGLQVAISTGLPSKVHVLSPLENITHEQSTQLCGKRPVKCNVQQTDSHVFFRWTASSEFGGFGFSAFGFGVEVGFFLAFKKIIFTFLLFKARLLDERDKFAGQDAHKVCEDLKVKKRSPLPKGKHKTRTTPSQEGQRLSRKYHPLFPLQELGWRLWSRSMT